MKRIIIPTLVALLVSGPVMADIKKITKNIWSDGEIEYQFLSNNTLKIKRLRGASMGTFEGAWKFGDKICALGKNIGNLKTFMEHNHCCMRAELIGDYLTLTEIAPFSGYCHSSTLKRKSK